MRFRFIEDRRADYPVRVARRAGDQLPIAISSTTSNRSIAKPTLTLSIFSGEDQTPPFRISLTAAM
jgi:hypothetical protein